MAMTRKKTPMTDPANLALVLLCQVEERKQVSTVYQFQSIETRVSIQREQRVREDAYLKGMRTMKTGSNEGYKRVPVRPSPRSIDHATHGLMEGRRAREKLLDSMMSGAWDMTGQ
jgi:hypothetical protein